MSARRGSREVTRQIILQAATELFAEHGVDGVSIRQIAKVAGVTHALVHRYFGTKEEMVSEIFRNVVGSFARTSETMFRTEVGELLPQLREHIRRFLNEERTHVLLLVRAEIDGRAPELLVSGQTRALRVLADWIASHQSRASSDGAGLPDPRLVSAVFGGALFALVLLSPWLSSAVGLEPEDFEARQEEIVDILVGILTSAAGAGAIS